MARRWQTWRTGNCWCNRPPSATGTGTGPGATAAAWTGGWFRTGDIARRAPDGYITLRGRRGDVIISGGFNIYPREIEELLAEHPAVAEASVVGMPDPARGEVPAAFVVLSGAGSAAAEELAAYCRDHLASFKTPRRIVFVERLPKTALGKVQKQVLKQTLDGGAA